MAQTSSASELDISTATTRSQSNLRASQSTFQIKDDTQSEEEAQSNEPQIEEASQIEAQSQPQS